MTHLGEIVRTRLLPALLTAVGVALVTVGLISWSDPSTAGVPATASPVTRTPAPAVSPSLAPPPSAQPSPPPSVAPEPTVPANRVATRVAVPALGIDLPVVLPPGGPDAYPLCDVAMYIRELGQPGQGRATYLYAHAREGMFLPLLTESREDPEGMEGLVVQVWTNDEQLYLYEITEVRPSQTTLDDALNADHEQLWLQTSEGPRGTVGKLQVVAEPLSSGPAPDPAAAHPSPAPVECE